MIVAILAFLTSISGFLGTGLTALLNWFLAAQAKAAAAMSGMLSAIADHFNDGKISVAEKESLDEQDADLDQQISDMNKPAPPAGEIKK
jgi:hypothetical protein